jgi:hypothetical protein
MASLLLKPAKNRIDKFIYSGLLWEPKSSHDQSGCGQRRSLETTHCTSERIVAHSEIARLPNRIGTGKSFRLYRECAGAAQVKSEMRLLEVGFAESGRSSASPQ